LGRGFRHGVGLYNTDLVQGCKEYGNLVNSGFCDLVLLQELTFPILIGFSAGEHRFLGDAITLWMPDGTATIGAKYPLQMQSGLNLTYGQINSLAGDFYASIAPISDGPDDANRKARFMSAYKTLGEKNSYYDNVAEAQKLLSIIQTEVDLINKALQNGVAPSEVYQLLENDWDTLQRFWDETMIRTESMSGVPNYWDILMTNWDHFGEDARTAYKAGHQAALEVAAGGNLVLGYAINAFADHYLQDSFAASHLRVPRRYTTIGSCVS